MKKIYFSVIAALSVAFIGTAYAGGHTAEKMLMEVEIPDTAIILSEGYVPTVFITGANRGIGLEFVKVYLEREYNIIATARKPEKAEALNALAADNDNLRVTQLDVTDFERVDSLALELQNQPIDILINNAGISGDTRSQFLGKMDYDNFRYVLEVNLLAPTKIAEAFYPNLLASEWKKLVVVSSSEGSIAGVSAPRMMGYRTSKAAINMMYTNIAMQLRKKGVTVVMVNPGLTDTDFVAGLPKKMLRPSDVAAQDMARNIDNTWVENTGTFWNYNSKALPW
jgi:NAD(P)-dependent dehydrogenase (short-subunit alcohol dehydrogenase family)